MHNKTKRKISEPFLQKSQDADVMLSVADAESSTHACMSSRAQSSVSGTESTSVRITITHTLRCLHAFELVNHRASNVLIYIILLVYKVAALQSGDS